MFDPFVQAATGQQSQEGTGLGLSISRQFVRLMGGDITASSELGHGEASSGLTCRLGWRTSAEARGVRTVQPRRRVIGLAPDQRAADGRPFRLLVVEDRGDEPPVAGQAARAAGL